MRTRILEKLRELERGEDCRILLAVESGSRAWGFASPDSDYDVRFIYVRPRAFYLRLDRTRDVIELPMDGELDINGWDLGKLLQHVHRSNPTVFEWLSSPIVYRATDFPERLKPVMAGYFSPRAGLWHYWSMAERTCREHLGGEMVRAKKYFYALRPVLACRWILEKGTPPPVPFSQLMDSQLREDLRPEVTALLDLKRDTPELGRIPAIGPLDVYLRESMDEIRSRAELLPKGPEHGWEELNGLFLSELG